MTPKSELINKIVEAFNLSGSDFKVTPIGTGHIHQTFKLEGIKKYILQRVNKNVFKKPEVIAANLKLASDFLTKHHPEYLFLTAIPTSKGAQMAYDAEGFPWRIFPYFDNTYTINRVESGEQAFSAAAEFGRLNVYLNDADVTLFEPTIDRFHDLRWRYEQFEHSLKHGIEERKNSVHDIISLAKDYKFLVDSYVQLIESGTLKIRITHNDTKINNILFDSETNEAVTAIDLDTLMPGYFIYDVGDMIRTFVSPVDEEEADLNKIKVRPEIYDAIVTGYLSQMKNKLTREEISNISFAGMMMTYIMALRMLTDFLNGDIYYKTHYNGQNLVRAKNQFRLLDLLRDFNQRQ